MPRSKRSRPRAQPAGIREIAQSLGVPERTIASRLAAARAKLQERLAEKEESGTLPARRVSL